MRYYWSQKLPRTSGEHLKRPLCERSRFFVGPAIGRLFFFFFLKKANKQTNKQINQITNSSHLWIDGGHPERNSRVQNKYVVLAECCTIYFNWHLLVLRIATQKKHFSILIRKTIRNSKHVLLASVGGVKSLPWNWA